MDTTLLVLAAGMGSRYGGLKQLDPVGPGGEVVLDYSVHDAARAGFNKVVFVIRREFEEVFRETVISRYEGRITVDLVFQDLAELPEGFVLPAGREKPWGTGHAIWCARHAVTDRFLAVNADDFYGAEAFSMMREFLTSCTADDLRMALVAYRLANTLSEHGAVSRGVCEAAPDRTLRSVEECVGILRSPDGRIRGTDTAGREREFTGEELVSMNFWGFTPAVFGHLERHFTDFLASGGLGQQKSEFYIPSAVTAILASGRATATVLPSAGHWFGVTYKEDRDRVARTLSDLTARGLYHSPLWQHSA